MELFGSTKNKIDKDINSENVPHLEIDEAVLVHCNIFNSDCQHNSRVSSIFVPDKSFVKLLNISPEYFVLVKAFNSEFSYIEVRFTDQSSKPLKIEDKINIT